MAEPQPPYPLLPPLSLLDDQARPALPINLEVLQRLEATPEHLHALAQAVVGDVVETAKSGSLSILRIIHSEETTTLICEQSME
jgi:hypothetical protein